MTIVRSISTTRAELMAALVKLRLLDEVSASVVRPLKKIVIEIKGEQIIGFALEGYVEAATDSTYGEGITIEVTPRYPLDDKVVCESMDIDAAYPTKP